MFSHSFFHQFRSLDLNKETAFEDLPEILEVIIKFDVSTIFEICESIAIGISVLISIFDGVFFITLIGLLFFTALLFNLDSHKTVSIHLFVICSSSTLQVFCLGSCTSQAAMSAKSFPMNSVLRSEDKATLHTSGSFCFR